MEAIQRQMQQYDHVRTSINELLEAVHQLDRVSDGIQKCVMDTRMVPIGPLFTRFKRVVRDISRSNNKEIRLVIHGENTELDKRMIDELGDPLIHIIRNSADHGIELPEVRTAAGKPAEGTIELDAMHRGNSIVIQIKDDGKGLDSAKIRAKAVQKGLMSQADADALTDQQAYQLIWEAGLSTAEKITEVSGRGMGMDIVRSKIEDISGTVELDSQPGVGTTITIKLPLTLAILPSLLAEIDGNVYAVPVETVSEIVQVAKDDITRVHSLDTAIVRGRVISLVRLSQLFEWNQPCIEDTELEASDDITLVIVGSDGKEIGLVVDKLIGEEDVVIKSLAENYRNVEGVAGASILGDGRVSLILDVGALVERSSFVSEPVGSV
jgi:two-component system chemotaxis sensor kinase CheA